MKQLRERRRLVKGVARPNLCVNASAPVQRRKLQRGGGCVQRKRRQRGSTVGYKSRSVSNSSGTRNSAQRSFAESAMLKMRPHFGPPRWLPACGTTIGRSGSIYL